MNRMIVFICIGFHNSQDRWLNSCNTSNLMKRCQCWAKLPNTSLVLHSSSDFITISAMHACTCALPFFHDLCATNYPRKADSSGQEDSRSSWAGGGERWLNAWALPRTKDDCEQRQYHMVGVDHCLSLAIAPSGGSIPLPGPWNHITVCDL